MGNVFAGNVIPADDRIHVKTTNLLDANLTITQAGFPAEAQGPLLIDVSNAAEVFLVETSGLSHQVTGLSTANLATSSESRLTMISSSARLVVAHPIFARPASGTVKLTPTSATAWKAQSTTGSLSTTFTIGKLQPGAIYAVKKNGSSFTTVTASDGGVASFIDTVGTTTISYTISPQ